MLHHHRMAHGILMGGMTPVLENEYAFSGCSMGSTGVMPRQAGPGIPEGLRQTCTSLRVATAIRFIAAMMTVAFQIIPLIEARWSVRCIGAETPFSGQLAVRAQPGDV